MCWERLYSILVDVGTAFVIEEIEDHRETPRGREYLVRWRGYEERILTWETIAKRAGDPGVDSRFARDYEDALNSLQGNNSAGVRVRSCAVAIGGE